MSNWIKKAAKTARVQTITDLKRTVNLVDDLIATGMLQLQLGECEASLYNEVFIDKSDHFIKNWCGNLMDAWFVKAGRRYSKQQVMTLYSMDYPGVEIGTYSHEAGYIAKAIFGKSGKALIKEGSKGLRA